MKIKSAYQSPPRQYPWDALRPHPTTIGVLWPCYGSGHVIYGLDCGRYTHRRLATLTLKTLDEKESTFFHCTPLVLDATVPLVHSWNVIPVNKSFIVSFEYELPRYLGSPSEAQLRFGMRLLEGPRCKGMLALSDFAYRHARRKFERHGFAHLMDKLSVFRGAVSDPQSGLAAPARPGPRPAFRDAPLSAILVGSELFRKGGAQVIRAFENLRAAGLNVRLTLIGDFEDHSYVWSDHIPDAKEWRARAASHSWIRCESTVPNAKVFDELRAHDICLYPSLDESLGWLTIEAGMLGIPVVGNRICAYPELIQHRRSGWLIDLPVDEDGRWAGIALQGQAHRAALAEADHRIVKGLEECIRHVYEEPDVLAEWGARARRRMVAMYGPAQASAQLQRIYDRALEPDPVATPGKSGFRFSPRPRTAAPTS
jgi:glycosyltransferase involved in cell wall biosynthesis